MQDDSPPWNGVYKNIGYVTVLGSFLASFSALSIAYICNLSQSTSLMLSLSYIQLDLLAAACGVLLLWYRYHTKKQNARPPLPPGPKSLPIIGNMKDLPSEKLWETYNHWAEEYGKWCPLFLCIRVKFIRDVRGCRSSLFLRKAYHHPQFVQGCIRLT